jgi:phosphoglycerate dehydrogenase-like enzyme
MKILIADKFSESHLARLKDLGCEVVYQPGAKAEDLPKLIPPFKILVVRSKQVTAENPEIHHRACPGAARGRRRQHD